MPRAPRSCGLILCERLDVNPGQPRISLVGVTQRLSFPAFPTPPQRFTAYVALLGGEGEGTMKLICQRLETEEIVYQQTKWTAFGLPDALTFVEMPVKKCGFPAPGRYRFDLRFDGKDIATTFLDILKERRRR